MDIADVLRDKRVIAVRTEADDVVTKAEAFVIVSEETAMTANEVLRWIARAKKELEERRTFFVKPLNEHVKAINALFKEVSIPLIRADHIMRPKVIGWRQKIEEAARKKQEYLQIVADRERRKRLAKAEATGKPPPPPPPMPVVEAPKTVGGVTTTKMWTFEVLDVSEVPRDYLELSSAKVRIAIGVGVREIPGIRIYEKDVIKVGI